MNSKDSEKRTRRLRPDIQWRFVRLGDVVIPGARVNELLNRQFDTALVAERIRRYLFDTAQDQSGLEMETKTRNHERVSFHEQRRRFECFAVDETDEVPFVEVEPTEPTEPAVRPKGLTHSQAPCEKWPEDSREKRVRAKVDFEEEYGCEIGLRGLEAEFANIRVDLPLDLRVESKQSEDLEEDKSEEACGGVEETVVKKEGVEVHEAVYPRVQRFRDTRKRIESQSCTSCWSPDHRAGEVFCRAPRETCYYCKQVVHFSRMCAQKERDVCYQCDEYGHLRRECDQWHELIKPLYVYSLGRENLEGRDG
ncbi:uncharacterized protein LOC108864694 [Galendromus occidentalis]|uniref:Uncharacterized protein LOC108864694 n=1 Tax=Galendromus occidentalis TaxID=34638 RepID=A0AAJ7PAE7_9ACAR|nr:uncharacterized protein LOC108864694 [Galendromus occidentalis]